MPRRLFLMIIAFAVFILPAVVSAAGGFTDVANTNVFKADIDWLAAAGVTKGCNPPSNTKFCPGDTVTREQMAAFMHRLAVNKVVDAKTAVSADTAADADKLDGKDSTAFLGRTEQASDSAKLNGKTAADLSSIAASVVFDQLAFPGTTALFKVISLTGFDVPANGGVLVATVTGWAAKGTDVNIGILWIEIDGTGVCSDTSIPTGASLWDTTSGILNTGSIGASNAAEVASGSHRVDVCTSTIGIATALLTGRLNVVWSESASSVGVASASGRRSLQDLLAPYAGALDN